VADYCPDDTSWSACLTGKGRDLIPISKQGDVHHILILNDELTSTYEDDVL